MPARKKLWKMAVVASYWSDEDHTTQIGKIFDRQPGEPGHLNDSSCLLDRRSANGLLAVSNVFINGSFRRHLADKIKPSTMLAYGTQAAGLSNPEYRAIATYDRIKGNYSVSQSVKLLGTVKRVTYSEMLR